MTQNIRQPLSFRRPLVRLPIAMAALLSGVLLSACTTNPATGERMFSLMSPEDEKQIGTQEHPKLVQEFGGEYKDPELARYVDSIGQLLAKTSEMPDLKFSFTILDSNIVNAMALPGGYIHVSRGLMALANNEAELASVMAHEIGHVTARHAAQRQAQATGASLGAVLAGVLLGSVGQQVAGAAGSYFLAGYSQDQEFQADSLGVRYLRRAGYDVQASADFLSSLRAQSQLEAQLAGLPPGTVDQTNAMATHPRTLDRVERAMAEAGGGPPAKDPIEARDIYLRKIHGMIYGDSPQQGYIRGTRFAHPELRFAFDVPQGYRLSNQPDKVVARGPNGTQIVFDMSRMSGGSIADYVAGAWARAGGIRLENVESFTANGMNAATGVARVNTNAGVRNLRLAAVDFGNQQVARFMILTQTQDNAQASATRQAFTSFRKLSASEAAALKPRRIQVVRVGSGDTVERLAARMAFSDYKVERFRVLNGLTDGQSLRPGQLVKIVVEGDVPNQPS